MTETPDERDARRQSLPGVVLSRPEDFERG